MKLTSQDIANTVDVLASFDPSSFLMHFNADDALYQPDGSGEWGSTRDLLNDLPTSLVAHEFSHAVQTATTSSGVREFMLALDLFRLGNYLIQRASEMSPDQSVRAPLLENVGDLLGDREFAETYFGFRRLLALSALYHGGLEAGAAQSKPLACPGLRVAEDLDAFGQKATYPVHLFDLSVVGLPRLVTLGYMHLAEGIGKAIEEIQRSLGNEPGRRIDDRDSPGALQDTLPPELFERYYLARYIFIEALARHGISAGASAEEFCVVAELALMADPLVMLYSTTNQPDASTIESSPGYPFDLNPFNTYLRLVEIYCSCYRLLPHLERGWDQQAANELQDALLHEAGYNTSVVELTKFLRNYASAGLVRLGPAEGFPFEDLPSLYLSVFMGLIDWRADVLHGGPVLPHLLAGRDSLLNLVAHVMPAITVGSTILSAAGAFRPGEGVGVDMVYFQTWCSTVKRLLTGDRACPLHEERPRRCSVTPWSLCLGLRGNQDSSSPRCIQDQALMLTKATSQVSTFNWTE